MSSSDVPRRILEGARTLFVRRGIRDVSLSELCRELHIAKKTFYAHYADKDALVAAVVRATLAEYTSRVLAAIESAPPQERAREVLRAVFSTSATCVSARMLADLEETAPRLWSKMERARGRLVTSLVEDLARGQQSGVYRADVDARAIGAAALLIVDRVLDPVVLAERGAEPHELASLLVDILFEGLYAAPTPPNLGAAAGSGSSRS